jgi:hypothetical protein
MVVLIWGLQMTRVFFVTAIASLCMIFNANAAMNRIEKSQQLTKLLPLPIVSIWMLPVGLALLAHDIPTMRAPMARLLYFTNRKIAEELMADPRAKHLANVAG